MVAELNFKVVMSTKDGKSIQKEISGDAAEFLMRKRIGELIKGDQFGFAGYEFLISGGSDKSGFPMRKGIQSERKAVMIGKGVGFSGKKRSTKKNKNRKQKGLIKRRTVAGEEIGTKTVQINLKVVKEGSVSLFEEAKVEEAPKEKSKE